MKKLFFLLMIVSLVLGDQTVLDVIKRIQKPVSKRLQPYLKKANLEFPFKRLTLLAFKEEKVLEVWGKGRKNWKFIKKYPFTGFSGKLGPKLKEGDGQIPEGIYKIDYLNPHSRYYLSIKINYPNKFDRKMARKDKRTNLGGDIFIHGESSTIGCIPIGNRAIEEIFYLIVKTGINNVKVIISPYDMREKVKSIEIPEINWEDKLYKKIYNNLKKYKKITERSSFKENEVHERFGAFTSWGSTQTLPKNFSTFLEEILLKRVYVPLCPTSSRDF